MGIYHCDVCSAKLMGETFGCDACARAHGDGGILCDECATEATCGDCGGACCHGCGNERFECCGKVLCGAGRDKELYTTAEALRQAYGVSRAACVWKHALLPPWPQCGHARCSLQPEGESCPACDAATKAREEEARVNADRDRVQALLDGGGLSASLSETLRAWKRDPGFLPRQLEHARQADAELQKRRRRDW